MKLNIGNQQRKSIKPKVDSLERLTELANLQLNCQKKKKTQTTKIKNKKEDH